MKSSLFGIYKRTVVLSFVLLLSFFVNYKTVAQSASVQNVTTHTVQKGDTLYSIGKKYGVSVEKLCEENNISKNYIIKIGQKLSIPSKDVLKTTASKTNEAKNVEPEKKETEVTKTQSTPTNRVSVEGREYDVYTVQPGDTLYRIAKVNDISVVELKFLNDLSDASKLRSGQKLKIPVTILNPETVSLPDLPSSDPRSYSTKKGDSSLTWPVENPNVTYMSGKVSGVQLSAKKEEIVKSIRAGTVMYTGSYRGYGKVIFVQSKSGYIYAYSGLGSITVKKGDYVVFGDPLGTAGTDSIKGTSQISLMVFLKSNPVDPAKAPRG